MKIKILNFILGIMVIQFSGCADSKISPDLKSVNLEIKILDGNENEKKDEQS